MTSRIDLVMHRRGLVRMGAKGAFDTSYYTMKFQKRLHANLGAFKTSMDNILNLFKFPDPPPPGGPFYFIEFIK